MTGRVTIGIDVGGTKIAGGLVCLETGKVIARRVVPTRPERGGAAVLTEALQLARTLEVIATQRDLPIAGIGVGLAELVDLAGNVRSSHLIAWQGLPVRERLAEIAPAALEADVRAAALAEARYGAGREHDPFVYVSVGTGISSCFVQGGKPYAGARGNALVLATAPLTVPCDACGEWTSHVLEEYASGPAIARRYGLLSGHLIDGAEVVTARAAAGDAVAAAVVATAGEALGNGIAWLINVLDPAAVIVGGGLGLAGGLFWERLVERTRANVWNEESRRAPILPAALGADAGLIGAAASAPVA
ncbi:MAG: ROK family protein [Thermomicrobiales bacterium]|nr:ROK family protein [Thermomicrobiales bacterium]